MDKKLKAKWVKALRSGRFTQGKESLYSRGKYCCLGVLACVVNGKRGEAGAYGHDGKKSGYTLAEEMFLSKKSHALQDMNDGKKPYGQRTFRQIADYIEANL